MGAGGISCENAITTIFSNTIMNNIGSHGGGIYLNYCAYSEISNNNIYNNSSLTSGGGGISINYSNAIINNNCIIGNTSTGVGGGISCNESSCNISENIISENSAGIAGGGIYISDYYENDIIINKSIISGNSVISETIECTGGGISIDYSYFILITNNLIIKNTCVSYGGGIHFNESPIIPVIKNNTIYGNFADSSGGGIYCHILILINNIIWNNEAKCSEQIDGSPDITYSNIQGGWSGVDNIDTDPLFRNPANEDYHLMSDDCGNLYNSSCIDAGNLFIPDSLLDCSWGMNTQRSDMGAYGGEQAVTDSSFSLITGVVTRINGTTTIPGVIVENMSTSYSSITTVDGQYWLYFYSGGNFDVSFSHEDYNDTIINGVEVALNDTTILDISLLELPGYLNGIVLNSIDMPLESVYVELNSDTALAVYTDENGYFEFCLNPGLYNVSFLYNDDVVASFNNTNITLGDTTRIDVIVQDFGIV